MSQSASDNHKHRSSLSSNDNNNQTFPEIIKLESDADDYQDDDDNDEVAHPQAALDPTDSAPQPEAALPPVNDGDEDDDERYSRSSTPDYMPHIFSDDDEEDDVDDEEDAVEENKMMEVEEEMDQNKSENNHDDSSSSDSESHKKKNKSPNSNECPLCKSIHVSTSCMTTHYRIVHLNWKPFYCKWTKCAFISGTSDAVETHIQLRHIKKNTTTVQQSDVADYVGQKVDDDDQPPTDTLLADHLLNTTGTKLPVTSTIEPSICPESFCPKCGRKCANPAGLKSHLESHGSSGFRCVWPSCGQFYSTKNGFGARRHVCQDHLGISNLNMSSADKKEVKKYLKLVCGEDSASSSASSDDSMYESEQSDSSKQPAQNCWKQSIFKCSRCAAAFTTDSNCAKHFREAHTKETLFRCTYQNCGYACLMYVDATKHIHKRHRRALARLCGSLVKVWNKKYLDRRYLASKRK